MWFDFMHCDDRLASVLIDTSDGSMAEIRDAGGVSKMPVGTVANGRFDADRFRSWWSRRAVSPNRPDVGRLLDYIGVNDTRQLMIFCLGMNLEDGYWLRPPGSGLTWEEINLFENGFTMDAGRFMAGVCDDIFSIMSPDLATGGSMGKMWIPLGRERHLAKFPGPRGFEAVNEVLSTTIAAALDIPHAEYVLDWVKGRPISVCESFLGKGRELVHAEDVMLCSETKPGESLLDRYERICAEHGLDMTGFMDRLTALDYLITNHDRHTGNLGIIRDMETLEWIAPAPAYDHGASFMGERWERPDPDYLVGDTGRYWEERLEGVRDLSWIDHGRLERAIGEAGDFLSGFEPLRRAGWDAVAAEMMGKRSEILGVLAEKIRCPASKFS